MHDFDKALHLVDAAMYRTVVAFGAFGDRFDHELSAINVLYRWQSVDRLMLVGDSATAILLGPGKHRIVPNPELEGPVCGLLPIGQRCDVVRSSGLVWDLEGQPLEFGGLVSSSNSMRVADDGSIEDVFVETSHPLVWTTAISPERWDGVDHCNN